VRDVAWSPAFNEYDLLATCSEVKAIIFLANFIKTKDNTLLIWKVTDINEAAKLKWEIILKTTLDGPVIFLFASCIMHRRPY
jgi:hypothetical protein